MKSVILGLLLSSGAVFGAPLELLGGESVRVKVAGQSKAGFAIHPGGEDGWRVRLGATQGAVTAELIDVTPGTPARTLRVAVVGGELFLDGVRFHGNHVYRVDVRRAGISLGSALVYLRPRAQLKEAPRRKEATRVDFASDVTEPVSDEIAPVTKSPL
jgi:hypothetical protein